MESESQTNKGSIHALGVVLRAAAAARVGYSFCSYPSPAPSCYKRIGKTFTQSGEGRQKQAGLGTRKKEYRKEKIVTFSSLLGQCIEVRFD